MDHVHLTAADLGFRPIELPDLRRAVIDANFASAEKADEARLGGFLFRQWDLIWNNAAEVEDVRRYRTARDLADDSR